jgi:hypothetical protein
MPARAPEPGVPRQPGLVAVAVLRASLVGYELAGAPFARIALAHFNWML